MTPAEKASQLALMCLKEMTGPRTTLSMEQFSELMQNVRTACAEARVDVATAYQAVVNEDRGLQNAIRNFGQWSNHDVGTCLRFK